MHALQQQYWAVRDYLAPVLKESKFKEHGRITPEEFVAAGDFLTYKFPVWSWEKGDATKARDYLPADKQYLVTRGVPCLRRATSLAYTDADEDAERLVSMGEGTAAGGEGDEWVETHAGRVVGPDASNPGAIDDIPDLDHEDDDPAAGLARGVANLHVGGANAQVGSGGQGAPAAVPDIPDLDEIPDMEDDIEVIEDEAAAAPKTSSAGAVAASTDAAPTNDNLLQVRTYDVMITYDKYYQTPRIWLLGYDENGRPLAPQQILQDVSAEHAFKTVTIEPFPHSASLQAASVHPCKHANVMKKVIERMNSSVVAQQLAQQAAAGNSKSSGGPAAGSSKKGGKWLFRRGSGKDVSAASEAPQGEEEAEGMRVDFYLVVFLKFIASIVPTIEVDSTTAF